MRVLVAMSGGVDSSVAAALLRDQGHDVEGVTLKLWGGEADRGCCSVSDVDDARRVADRLGIEHHTFGFADDFDRHVVQPYVSAHRSGQTPNPCIECNRHLKFDLLLDRALTLGFDAVATGHHARIATRPDGTRRVARGADRAKDQSYVLHVLDQRALARTLLPVGDMTKAEVRRRATALGLRTADKPDSQDVCFIRSDEGRARFLAERLTFTPGRVVSPAGDDLGPVDRLELVTVGQRRGLHLAGGAGRRFALHVDTASATVVAGTLEELVVDLQPLADVAWADGGPPSGTVAVQCSAHGEAQPAVVLAVDDPDDHRRAVVAWAVPQRRVAPGQAVVVYDGDEVVGGGVAAPLPPPSAST